jgi:pantothenate kinase
MATKRENERELGIEALADIIAAHREDFNTRSPEFEKLLKDIEYLLNGNSPTDDDQEILQKELKELGLIKSTLAEKLAQAYREAAESNLKAETVIAFGYEHAYEIESVIKLIEEAGLPSGYPSELRKGVKLRRYNLI